jgi:hypothetical protein
MASIHTACSGNSRRQLGGDSALVIVGPGPQLILGCADGFVVERGTVGIAGLKLLSGAQSVIKTVAVPNSVVRLVLGGVKISGNNLPASMVTNPTVNGVHVSAGTTARIVAVSSDASSTPFFFSGSGLLGNSVAVPASGGGSRLEPDGHLDVLFNNFAGSVTCNTSNGILDVAGSLAPNGNTCGMAAATFDDVGREVTSAANGCRANARSNLTFDVDLERRPGGTDFDCGADEASR